ncbi:MAG: hypothetical protein SGPRY_001036, partial [Prymnesium sp.]
MNVFDRIQTINAALANTYTKSAIDMALGDYVTTTNLATSHYTQSESDDLYLMKINTGLNVGDQTTSDRRVKTSIVDTDLKDAYDRVDGITVADQDVGVPRKALSGSFTVVTYGEFAQSTALGDSSIAIDLASAATLTAFSTNYTPRLKVTRYRYTDMSTKNALWQESTKEPTAS